VLRGVITEDPLKQLPIGSTLDLSPVVYGGANATPVPNSVTNWAYFEGALLSVLVGRATGPSLIAGTAVMIAPGLAMTATHVIEDYLPQLVEGHITLMCVGPATDRLDLWRVSTLSTCPTDDITYLSLQLASALSPTWRFHTLAVTTRAPKPGESVTVIGFRFPEVAHESPLNVRAAGALYAAAGSVTNVYHPLRDRVLMPYPSIEVACGSLKGMSGGALLDGRGYLLGVLSRGFQTDSGDGPSFVSWIVGALNRQLTIPWPPGMYPQLVHILDIDNRVLRMEGRDHIDVVDENTVKYRVWFDRQD
jgi:hypothetical protein